MKNVTVTLDEVTALRVRLEATRRNISVSSLVRQMLTEHMDRQAVYEGAKDRYLSREPSKLSERGNRHPAREQLHDRSGPR